MTDRQTLSFLAKRLEEVGLQPKLKYGQNFLIDLNLIDLLVRTAEIDQRDVILEVGTGAGSLTAKMAPLAGFVVTVEIDRDLLPIATKQLDSFKNISFLAMDILKKKHEIQEEAIEEIRNRLATISEARLKLVANLPYNIATPLVSNLLSIDPVPERMVITIQKELAERITAKPRTKDYSALSLWIQSQCDCEIVRVMPPSVFWPRPKVESAILLIKPNAEKRMRLKYPEYFHQTVRDIFCHRRKFLRSSMISALQDQFEKSGIDAILKQAGHGAEVRAEELSVEQMIELVELCHDHPERIPSASEKKSG